jgi:hypothetical protein
VKSPKVKWVKGKGGEEGKKFHLYSYNSSDVCTNKAWDYRFQMLKEIKKM